MRHVSGILLLALSVLTWPVQARERVTFITEWFDVEDLDNWYLRNTAENLAETRRDNKASKVCQEAGGSFWPVEYAVPGVLQCHQSQRSAEHKCRFIHVKALCRKLN